MYILNNRHNIAVLIPTYEPDSKFVKLIQELTEDNFENILVIDDGSSKESQRYFEQVENNSNVTIIRHDFNRGKGKALKTGFNYIQENLNGIDGCVTVDADGQHLLTDINSCVAKFNDTPNKLVLGVRNFEDASVPFRSKFGNKLTVKVLSLLTGVKVNDTQTGLRVVPVKDMKNLLKIKGDRYEYELRMLIATKDLNIKVAQVPINTVYIADNESSHFNPIKDSLKIYKVFLKYVGSSLFSSIVDIFLFTLFIYILKDRIALNYIVISTIVARVVSVLVNYNINAIHVFKSNNNRTENFYRYISLATFQMLVSATLVYLLSYPTTLHLTIIKIFVDIFLFFVSFVIQKDFVFAKEKKLT